MLKDCTFLDICFKTFYNMTCYESDEELCEGCPADPERGPLTCKPENIYMEGDRVYDIALMPGLWMIHVNESNVRLDYDKVKLCLTRHLLCRTGCEETVQSVTHPFYANHMIIPGGEYEICIPPQQAPGYIPCTPYKDGCLTVVIEPVTQDQVQAMKYNADVVFLEEAEQRRNSAKKIEHMVDTIVAELKDANAYLSKLCGIEDTLLVISEQIAGIQMDSSVNQQLDCIHETIVSILENQEIQDTSDQIQEALEKLMEISSLLDRLATYVGAKALPIEAMK